MLLETEKKFSNGKMYKLLVHQYLLFATSLPILVARATYSFDCPDVWDGPSADNDLDTCARQLTGPKFGLLLPALIPTIFFGLLLLCYPIIYIGRCCGGCGSRKLRPGASCCGGEAWDRVDNNFKEQIYPASHIKCIKVSAFLLAILSIAVLVTVPLGISQAWEGWSYILDRAEPDVIGWLANRKADVVSQLRSADGSLPPPLDNDSFTAFDDAIRLARETRGDIQRYSDDAALPVAVVSYVLSAIPLILLTVTVLFGFCNVRGVGIDIMSFLHYFFGLLFGGLGAVLLVSALVAFMMDGEMQYQQRALPGALGWWGVPKCESEIDFAEFRANISSAISQAAAEGCNQLLEVCDGDATVPAINNPKQFYCPSLAASNTSVACRSVKDLTFFIENTYAKAGSQVCGSSNCSVSQCPTQCSLQEFRDYASEALAEVAEGARIQSALSQILTFADCDILIDRATLPFAKLELAGEGLLIAGCGATFAIILLILGLLVLCKGQKLFFGRSSKRRVEEIYHSPTSHPPDGPRFPMEPNSGAAAGPPQEPYRYSYSNFPTSTRADNASWSMMENSTANRH